MKKLSLLILSLSLIMILIVISCGGGGGGGGIIPPFGGGGGGGNPGGGGSGNTLTSFNNLNTNQAWIIISTKQNAINTNSYSFQFTQTSPNITSSDNQFLRNQSFIQEYRCGFRESQKSANYNILQSQYAPSVGQQYSFSVTDSNNNQTDNQTVQVTATCFYVSHNPKFAIYVDNNDNVLPTSITSLATRFSNDYNTLTTNANINLNFYVDILITSKVDSSSTPTVIGYFWGSEDPERVNLHPTTFQLSYGTYNEANVTLAHEFVHLLEYHGSSIGNHDAWIAEGLATYGEELCGYSSGVRLNSIRVFLNNPETTSLVTSTPTFANYGKSFLFVKLLNQRFNNAWGNMVTSSLNGITLIENINGTEDFNRTMEIFNVAVILDENNNNFGFNGINLNNIDRNGDNFGNDKGVFKFDESDNNGFKNRTLNQMSSLNQIFPYSAFYIYRTSAPFSGNIEFLGPSGLSFNTITPLNLLNYNFIIQDSSDIRITLVYK